MSAVRSKGTRASPSSLKPDWVPARTQDSRRMMCVVCIDRDLLHMQREAAPPASNFRPEIDKLVVYQMHPLRHQTDSCRWCKKAALTGTGACLRATTKGYLVSGYPEGVKAQPLESIYQLPIVESAAVRNRSSRWCHLGGVGCKL
jgi:hypothetical protein